MPSYDGIDTYESPNEYGTIPVQAGMFSSADGTRTGVFLECFPPGSIIRAEGATLEEADAAAWAKLQAFLSCRHEWEPRGYSNGCGICRHCGQFGSGVFSPEGLGLSCTVCGVPTLHTYETADGDLNRCKAHDPRHPYHLAAMQAGPYRRTLVAAGAGDDEVQRATEMSRRLSRTAYDLGDEDPEALAWAREHLNPGE